MVRQRNLPLDVPLSDTVSGVERVGDMLATCSSAWASNFRLKGFGRYFYVLRYIRTKNWFVRSGKEYNNGKMFSCNAGVRARSSEIRALRTTIANPACMAREVRNTPKLRVTCRVAANAREFYLTPRPSRRYGCCAEDCLTLVDDLRQLFESNFN